MSPVGVGRLDLLYMLGMRSLHVGALPNLESNISNPSWVYGEPYWSSRRKQNLSSSHSSRATFRTYVGVHRDVIRAPTSDLLKDPCDSRSHLQVGSLEVDSLHTSPIRLLQALHSLWHRWLELYERLPACNTCLGLRPFG